MIDWISVDERLPEELNNDRSRKVVLTYDMFGRIRKAFILCNIWNFLDDDNYVYVSIIINVTHWAELNKPAKNNV